MCITTSTINNVNKLFYILNVSGKEKYWIFEMQIGILKKVAIYE